MLRSLVAKLGLGAARSSPRVVTLRNERSAGDVRRLHAALSATGDLLIEGYDYGDGVEALLGEREYEWRWTVAAAELPKLKQALGEGGDLLPALQRRFSGPDAADLAAFLERNQIAYSAWSRCGD